MPKRKRTKRQQQQREAKKGALEQGSSVPPTTAKPEAVDEDRGPEFWVSDDIDNGRHFAKLNNEQVKYIGNWQRWFEWTGRVWSEDAGAARARELAKRTAKLIKAEARKSSSKEYRQHAEHSCSRNGIEAMLKMAESDGRIRMRSDEFDGDPWLLNVANGTVDLRTGELREEHCRNDYITKVVEIAFEPDAPRNSWDDFLEQMVPDPSVRDYLQRAVGYTLTGVTNEQKFFLLYGRGASGKGTFIEAIDGIMGSYATIANFRLFLDSQDKRFDMWRHAHSRMVSAQEVREGQRFDEGTLKLMVGGDVQTAERKYCDQFQFTPHWTVWLGANARPHIEADDDAMWRRVRIIPFTNSLPEEKRDPRVRTKLRSDREVQKRILAWAVKGTRMWLKRPLHMDVPEAVSNAAADYRALSDNFREFFDLTFTIDREGFTPTGAVQETYREYCTANDEMAISQNQIARHLTEMRFKRTRRRNGGEPAWGWLGFVAQP